MVALVALDLLTKEFARRLLPLGVAVDDDAWLELVLRLNDTGLGAWASPLFANSSGDDLVVGAVGQLALVPYLLCVRQLRWSAFWTFVAGLGVLGVMAVLTSLGRGHPIVWVTLLAPGVYWVFVNHRVSDLTRRILAGYGVCIGARFVFTLFASRTHGISRWTASLAARATAFVLCLAVLWLVRRSAWRVPALLLVAAALGNGISQAIPPHAIVDFIHSAPLTRFAGCGVMNIADLYFDAALLSVVGLVLRAVARRFAQRPPALVKGAGEASSLDVADLEDERNSGAGYTQARLGVSRQKKKR